MRQGQIIRQTDRYKRIRKTDAHSQKDKEQQHLPRDPDHHYSLSTEVPATFERVSSGWSITQSTEMKHVLTQFPDFPDLQRLESASQNVPLPRLNAVLALHF